MLNPDSTTARDTFCSNFKNCPCDGFDGVYTFSSIFDLEVSYKLAWDNAIIYVDDLNTKYNDEFP